MNASVFTTLFIVLILIVVFFTVSEGFQMKEPVLHIPESPVKQKNLVEKSQEDYAPNYVSAPGPPPGAIASFNSLPYRDPNLEKANYQRILNAETTLKGFLDNEAPGLEELSDPSIQLPLTSARADLAKLKSELLVLKRNPGIDSSLTQEDVDEIQANLSYLQDKWRRSIYNDLDVEGFQDSSGANVPNVDEEEFMATDTVYNNIYEDIRRYRSRNSITDTNTLSYRFLNFVNPLTANNRKILKDGTIVGGFESYRNAYDILREIGISVPSSSSSSSGSSSRVSDSSGSTVYDSSGSNVRGSSSSSSASSSSSSSASSSSSTPAPTITLAELRDLITKIDITKSRLTSSGTTDPVILARVSVLDKIKKRVQDILNEVTSGARKESEIPITKDAYANFLKSIANINSPVSKLFGSNVALADLLPAYSEGDVDGAKLSQYLFTKYSDMLFNGLSFNVNLSYTSPAERALVESVSKSIVQRLNVPNLNVTSKMLQAYDINTSNNTFSQVLGSNAASGYNANIFSDLNNKYFGSNSPTPNDVLSNYSYKNNASPFDWQERANFICESIQKRGLNPKDFGCLRPDEYVSENFSWRGYAKMVCGRLATSMDTGLPEVCGCPPSAWSGWRP